MLVIWTAVPGATAGVLALKTVIELPGDEDVGPVFRGITRATR